MPKITVGVPVHNGGTLLSNSLDCLMRQDVEDVEFLLCDNASTDGTHDTMLAFAERDPRFRIIRRDVLVGAIENFAGVLDRSDSRYFCWRAHDDISSDNWLRRLSALLDGGGMDIATGRILRWNFNTGKRRRVAPHLGSPPSFDQVIELLASNYFPHIYQLWRRDYLAPRFARTHLNPDLLPVADGLISFEAMVSGRLGYDRHAWFQQTVGAGTSHEMARADDAARAATAAHMQAAFEEDLAKSRFTPEQTARLHRMLPLMCKVHSKQLKRPQLKRLSSIE